VFYCYITALSNIMALPDDHRLLQLAREGNAAAFEALIRRHDRSLYRIVRSILLDDAEAEDVVQETFISAYKHLEEFRGEASLSTWFTRIAINEALARKRRRRGGIQLETVQSASEGDVSVPITGGRDPEDVTAQQQIRNILERAIDSLPDDLRTVLIMRDVEELSTTATAELLDLKETTVKVRLHRARRLLRKLLSEKIGPNLKDVFPFERSRCDRLVERLLNLAGLG
jgi:RNA polymerase sigma-70 factor (ECF subfamily)